MTLEVVHRHEKLAPRNLASYLWRRFLETVSGACQGLYPVHDKKHISKHLSQPPGSQTMTLHQFSVGSISAQVLLVLQSVHLHPHRLPTMRLQNWLHNCLRLLPIFNTAAYCCIHHFLFDLGSLFYCTLSIFFRILRLLVTDTNVASVSAGNLELSIRWHVWIL